MRRETYGQPHSQNTAPLCEFIEEGLDLLYVLRPLPSVRTSGLKVLCSYTTASADRCWILLGGTGLACTVLFPACIFVYAQVDMSLATKCAELQHY